VSQGRQDILTEAIGIPEHPGRVRTAGFGVGVRQFFGSASWSSSSKTLATPDQLAKIREDLRREMREEIRREMKQVRSSMGMTQQDNPMQQDETLPMQQEEAHGRVNTKRSYADDDEDEDEEELQTHISYLCKLFARDPPRVVAIGRVYATSSTIHTLSLREDLSRVVVEKVKVPDAEVSEPTSEIRFVGQSLGTFIAWLTHLLKVISKKHKV